MSWLPPPPPPRPRSRSIWKRWWFWAIVIVVILIAGGAGGFEQVQTEGDQSSPSPIETASPTPSPTPQPSPTPPPVETARVPKAIGEPSDTARSRLEAAGFDVSVETKLTDAARPGTVLRQSESPGSRVEVGDTITLTVARPLPKIPNVVGKTLANAKRTLKNAGFEVGKVTQQTSSKRKGTVISQSPAAKTSARLGREVSLVTAKPAPEPVSNCTSGYSPCLPPASDYDCAGGSGDGPKYVNGTVQVTGSDPYGLDSDNDGVGCE